MTGRNVVGGATLALIALVAFLTVFKLREDGFNVGVLVVSLLIIGLLGFGALGALGSPPPDE